jgi:hypothetical protein
MNIVKPTLPEGWTFSVYFDDGLGTTVIQCSGPGYNWSVQVVKSADPNAVEQNVNSILADYADRAAAAEKVRADWSKKQLAEAQDRIAAKALSDEIKRALPGSPRQIQGR